MCHHKKNGLKPLFWICHIALKQNRLQDKIGTRFKARLLPCRNHWLAVSKVSPHWRDIVPTIMHINKLQNELRKLGQSCECWAQEISHFCGLGEWSRYISEVHMKVHQISHEPKRCMIGLPIVYVNMRTLVYNLRRRTIGNETSIDWLNHR